jgi:DNA repair protein RadA/Sms
MKLQHIQLDNVFTQASKIEIPEIYFRRLFTGAADLDYVFGNNGLLPGSVFTIAAAAGVGKTTFFLQVEELMANNGKKVGYISGEESIHQLAFTCRRINVNKVHIANMTNIDEIVKVIRSEKFDFVMIDSYASLTTTEEMNTREKEAYIANLLVTLAKETEVIIGLILHMTKAGQYKGSTVIPHTVDMNILMALNDEDPTIRDITVTKNRFGFAGQSSFVMNSTGFDFIKVESSASLETLGKRDKAPSKKDTVLAFITEKGKVTQTELIQLVGSIQYVNNITKELLIMGKIQKDGKGGAAEYCVSK